MQVRKQQLELICRVHHEKCWAGRSTSWNQDCWEKYQKLRYADQEAAGRTGDGTRDWFQIGKGVRQGCVLSPCLFNFYTEYIMRNAELEKHKLELRLPGEISITSDMQMTPPLWQ